MDSPFFGQGLAYADLRQWIIRKCNLLVLDGAVVSQSKKKKKALWWCNKETNPGVALLAGNNESKSLDGDFFFASAAVCTAAIISRETMWRFHTPGALARLLFFAPQMNWTHLDTFNSGDLLPRAGWQRDWPALVSVGRSQAVSVHFVPPFLQGKLEVRLLGCEDLLKAKEKEHQPLLPEESAPTSPGSQGSPGETRPFKSELI